MNQIVFLESFLKLVTMAMEKNQQTSRYQGQTAYRCLLVGTLAWVSMLGSAVPGTAQTSPSRPAATEPIPSSVTPAPRIARPNLNLESQGEAVTELQALLQLLGFYTGPITGRYGVLTQEAVQAFQTSAGLTPDGIVGPATWSRLLPAPAAESVPPTTQATTPATSSSAQTVSAEQPSPASTPALAAETASRAEASQPLLRLGMEGDAVTRLQQRLKDLGFYQGSVDGIFGSQTEQAVKAAQEYYDLTPDGIVGPATWSALDT